MLSKLDKIKQRVSGKGEESSITTSLYLLIKELGCLPEILGREYEVYDKDGTFIYRIKQKAITIPSLITLLQEMEKDYKRQEKEYKKMKSKKR
jgi:hypothetical protein